MTPYIVESIIDDCKYGVRQIIVLPVFCSDDTFLWERLEHWLEMPWESDEGVTKTSNVQQSQAERLEPTSTLWPSTGGIIHTDRSFWPLLALTNGYLMKVPPETTRWLQMVDRLMDGDIAVDTWAHYCRELRWICLRGCDLELGRAVIHKLLTKHPSLKLRPEFCRLVAMVSGHLSETFVKDFLTSLATSDEFEHRQAYGELLMLIALRDVPHKWAQQLLQIRLAELGNDLERIEPVATGFAFTAARLWDEPDARSEACRVLCQLIPHATTKISSAIGTVFWSTENFSADEHTDALLRAFSEKPDAISVRFVSDLIEHLTQLLPHCRGTVLAICRAIVHRSENEPATSLLNELFASGPHLVNIAMTLQRFSDTRSEGLSLLESLLRLGLDDAFTMLHDIDIRPASISRREPRRRRRRRKRDRS